MSAGRFLMRVYHPLRNLFDMFDRWDLNSEERETTGNVERFKSFVKIMISQKRKEVEEQKVTKQPASFDFLSQLINDPLYNNDDK